MLHSYTRVFIHLVWSTKGRERLLVGDARTKIHSHIIEYAKENSVIIDEINIQPEHLHVLIELKSDQRIEDVAKRIKGESSHWMNAQNIIPQKFAWQRGYGGFSVSPGHVGLVRNYIQHQDEHHRRRTFAEEFHSLLQKYGFDVAETDESVESH